MRVLRSCLYAIAFYVASPAFVIAAALAGLVSDAALRRVALAWCGYHRWCATWLAGVRSAVEGVVPDGPMLIAVRHESFYETLEAPLLFGAPAIVAKAELGRLPLWGNVARRYGLIPVERRDGAAALRVMLRSARAALAEGRSVLIFPEGTRIGHGEYAPLQPGFAGLYKALGLPVLPVAVASGQPFRSFLKRPGIVPWCIGEPIPPGLDRQELERRVALAINMLNAPGPADWDSRSVPDPAPTAPTDCVSGPRT